MSITIQIPTPLRSFAGGQGEIEVEATTVGQALQELARLHPALTRHLFNDAGVLRSFINVFVNDEDSRHLGGQAAPLKAGDSVLIIPSIAGGRR